MNTHPNRIPLLIDLVVCDKHEGTIGSPCFHIKTGEGRILPAVCNQRAQRAGFTGKVTSEARMVSNAAQEQLKAAYPSTKWAEKVDQMSESQVAAVYLRLKRQNKLKENENEAS